jgi:hypothetical protein
MSAGHPSPVGLSSSSIPFRTVSTCSCSFSFPSHLIQASFIIPILIKIPATHSSFLPTYLSLVRRLLRVGPYASGGQSDVESAAGTKARSANRRPHSYLRPFDQLPYLGSALARSSSLHVGSQSGHSADDRDYCEYSHVIPPSLVSRTRTSVREVTVKSFSPTRHIRRPGFHMLSLIAPYDPAPSPETLADAPCFLPDHQHSIYTPLLWLTLLVLLIRNIYFKGPSLLLVPPTPAPLSTSKKHTIDEYNDEYEEHMIPTPTLVPNRRDSSSWSPWVPATPLSATNGPSHAQMLPSASTPRTSHSLAPIQTQLRVPPSSSRPSSVHLSPMAYSPSELMGSHSSGEEDEIHPTQYAIQRERQFEVRMNGSWSKPPRRQDEATAGSADE